jgi:hypothetical protein
MFTPKDDPGTVSHAGRIYPLAPILEAASTLSAEYFSTESLMDVLDNCHVDPKAVAAADTNSPILIVKGEDGYTVIDGLEPLLKALSMGRLFVKVKFLPTQLFD